MEQNNKFSSKNGWMQKYEYFKNTCTKKERGRKMANKKNKFSVSKVINKKDNIVGYLSTRDEERGLDAVLDLQGYTIVAL